MKRQPVAAGTFYSLEKNNLKKEIEHLFFTHEFGPKKIEENRKLVAGIVPHAGYMYSGAVAAHFYSKIKKANFFIIGPNHYGLGSIFSIYSKGSWITPLGEIFIDDNVSRKIIEKIKIIKPAFEEFLNEHSIEVQLPFLQFRFGNSFKIVPIAIINDYPHSHFLEISRLLAKTLAEFVGKWKLIVTSDFSHYVPHEFAVQVDKKIIESITSLNTKEFFKKILELKATLCGFVPIAISMEFAKILDLKPVVYKYATSGDITGEFDAVVGYASIGFEEK